MKKLFIISLVFIAAACAKKAVPVLSESDVSRGEKIFPGLTINELNEGKRLNDENCGKCHKLHQPKDESETEWRKIVPPMAKKAKLDDQQAELVLKYLVTMSKGS